MAPSMPLSTSRCAPAPSSITCACRTARRHSADVRHAGRARRRTRRLSSAHRDAGRPHLALHRRSSSSRAAARAANCPRPASPMAPRPMTCSRRSSTSPPATVTRELFRGIANDRGKLAFNGKMIVRESAHDADSDQSLKTLLTGSGAEAAARPQLEIYTDRVRAKHGATTGKLDDADAVLPAVARHRPADRPDAAAVGIHRRRRVARSSRRRCAARSNT